MAVLLVPGSAAQTLGEEPLNSVPGSLGESVKVNADGAFTYQIPIDVPPGIGGVEPKLSLSYDSQGGNGMLGMGWSLSGLASIERTPRIRAIDGINGAVAYDANDRYALQGERLIVISGANGASDSTYRTEIESWRRVVANGQAGSGPASFTVTSRSGAQMTFGDSPDSAPTAGDLPDVQSWCFHTVTDLHGNTLTVTYTEDPLSSGVSDYRCYPLRIDYAANSGANQAANRSVRFLYEARTNDPNTYQGDNPTTYQGGAPLGLSARLGNIQTYVGEAIVSNYELAYETSPSTGRSRLTTVTRSASDDPGAEILSPATFSYSDSGQAFTGKQTGLAEFTRNQGYDGLNSFFTLADVNGDGFSDIVGFKSGSGSGVQVALGNAAGFQASTPWINDFTGSQGWTPANPRLLADVDGDGLADIVGFSSSGVETALSTGSSFRKMKEKLSFFSPTQGWTGSPPRMLQDANGDQRMDIIGVLSGKVSVALGQQDGTFATQTTWLLGGFGITTDIYQVADMNGDGNADVININGSTLATTVALSTAAAFTTSGWTGQGESTLCQPGPPARDTPVFLSDANGDGLVDFIAFCNSSGPPGPGTYVSISTGKGLLEASQWDSTFAGAGWPVGNLRMAADLNGDGLVDLVGVQASNVIARLSTDQAFEAGDWDQDSLSWRSTTSSTRFMVDANADGLLDMVGIGGPNVEVSTSAGPYPDLLIEAVRSAGATYTVTYAPLSDSGVYQESQPQALAQFQNFPPLSDPTGSLPQLRSAARLGGNYHVVKMVSVDDNPAVGDTTFHYASTFLYEDGLLDLDGRGWLGFARVTQDSQTGARRLVRDYHQDFPFIGMLKQGQLLDHETLGCDGEPTPYTSALLRYDKQQTATASDSSEAPVYFPYQAKRAAGAYHDCAVIVRVGSESSYDDYGNLSVLTRLGLVDAKGADLDPGDNVYTLTQYSNDTTAWQLGYPEYKKVSASSSLENMETFDDDVDLSLRSWTYNDEMNPLTQQAWDDGNDAFIGYAYTYNDFGLVHTRTSPTGSVRTTTYEPTYNTYPQSITQTTTDTTSLAYHYGYDPRFGLRSVTVDPNNVSQITCLDAFGRRVTRQGLYPDARTTGNFDPVCVSSLLTGAPAAQNVVTLRQLQYGWQGELPTVTAELLSDWPTDATRSTFELRRTQDGLWRKSTTAVGDDGDDSVVLQELTYAERGRIVCSALPYTAGDAPNYATTQYDVAGRPTHTEVPTGATGEDSLVTTTVYAATSTGGTASQTTAPGTDAEIEQILTYGFAANRPRVMNSETVGLPGSTDYAYDLQGRGWSLTAPAGQDNSRPQWTRTYDSLGRIVATTSPARGTITSHYDESGLLHSRTQDSGSFQYTRDLVGRLQVAEGSDGVQQIQTWDGPIDVFGQGRVASGEVVATVGEHSQVVNHTDYTYDSTGRVDTETLTLALAPDPYPVSRSYDPQGRMIEVNHPDGSQMVRTYDGLKLSSVSLEEASVAFSDYAPTGWPQTFTYGNGTTLTSTFTVDGLPLSQLVEDPADDTLLSRQYRWDEAQRLAEIDDTDGEPTPEWNYRYDALRLVDATADNGGESWSLQYDGAGNLTQFGETAYQYTGTLATEGEGDNGFTADYGAMGRMKTLQVGDGPTYRFAYDATNRLVAAKANDGREEGSAYVYDHTGRMVAAILPDGEVTVYVAPSYWDVRSNGQSSPLRVLKTFGQVQAQWGTASGDASRFYVHTDHQRSTLMTTGASGQAVTRLAYTPQGAIREGDPGALRFTYTGLEQDPYTGFYYMGARQYHPGIARFSRPDDQLGGGASLGDSANDMAYVLNSPAMYLDPTGHAPSNWACFVISIGGAGMAAGGFFDDNQIVGYVGAGLSIVGFVGCSLYQDGSNMYQDVKRQFFQEEGSPEENQQLISSENKGFDDISDFDNLDNFGNFDSFDISDSDSFDSANSDSFDAANFDSFDISDSDSDILVDAGSDALGVFKKGGEEVKEGAGDAADWAAHHPEEVEMDSEELVE